MNKIIILLPLLALVGCAPKYTCGEFPGAECMPVSDVYKDTNDGLRDYRKEFYARSGGDEKDDQLENDQNLVNVSSTRRTIALPSPGQPILTKPVVLRVMIKAWEDKDKDLNSGSYVFVRLRDSEWVID